MGKRATLKDVAKLAGVTTATVSYVLHKKQNISQETQEKVMAAIKELNYVPNLAARELSMKNSRLIGVVVPQTEPGNILMFENTFYSEILGSIEYEARKHGYHILISATDTNENYLRLAQERNLDGIIVIGMYPDQFYQQIKKTQIPIVLIDSYCNDHYFHNVRIDDAYGSYMATKYVLDCGHKETAFICGQLKENGVMIKRLAGYRQALEEKGIEFRCSRVYEGKINYNSGIDLPRRLLEAEDRVTAVVAAADILAMGVIKGLYEKGIKVPEDISVIGFDDLQISKCLTPGLTTVKQEIQSKGKEAMELLFKSINDSSLTKRERILPVTLVERDSVKKLND